MPNIEIIAIQSHKIIEESDDIFDILVEQQRAIWIGNSKDTLSFIL